MKFEIDLPEHQYNNIIAFSSINIGRVPYKGIIMYAINAIKNATPVDQDPNVRHCFGCKYSKDNHNAGTEECHLCMWENQYTPTTKNDLGVDLISRADAIKAMQDKAKKLKNEDTINGLCGAVAILFDMPSVIPQEPKWIPVSERLPNDRDWYLGIFKEPDTGWINRIPFICDYVGRETEATTKEYWILRGCTDRDEHIDYYFNLECVAWMPLPKPYKR